MSPFREALSTSALLYAKLLTMNGTSAVTYENPPLASTAAPLLTYTPPEPSTNRRERRAKASRTRKHRR